MALTLSTVSVAASYELGAAAEPDIRVQTVDSRSARIARVQTRVLEQELYVSGYLRKRHLARGFIPGRLVIEVLADDGSILAKTDSRYHRRGAKATRSYFSESLPVSMDKVSRVRVIHYGLGD